MRKRHFRVRSGDEILARLFEQQRLRDPLGRKSEGDHLSGGNLRAVRRIYAPCPCEARGGGHRDGPKPYRAASGSSLDSEPHSSSPHAVLIDLYLSPNGGQFMASAAFLVFGYDDKCN